MDPIRLPEPIPHPVEEPFQEYPVARKATRYLPTPDHLPDISLASVLDNRRTVRDFTALDDISLSRLFWMCMKTRRSEEEPSGFLWQHRPLPSSGGRQCVNALLITQKTVEPSVELYDPNAHALVELHLQDQAVVSDAISTIEGVVPVGAASIIWFAADYERVSTRYANGESLLWRDAGIHIAGFALAAEALELNSCAIGLTGDEWVPRIFGSKRFTGVGGLLVGGRRSRRD
jgi:hypothetical protein